MRVYSQILAALTVLWLSGPVDAAMVTMRFTGIVGSIDPGPTLPSSLSIGDPFSGTYTYDDSVQTCNEASGCFGIFLFGTAHPISLDFEVAGVSFHLDGDPVHLDFGEAIATQPSLIRVIDGGPSAEVGDSYEVEIFHGLRTTNGISEAMMFAGLAVWDLGDYLNLTPTSALSDLPLPMIVNPYLAGFSFYGQWYPPSGARDRFSGALTSLTAPEPRLSALFPILLAVLALWRRLS